MTDIFSPTNLGALSLSNRIVMAPMTRDRAGPDDVPTDLMVEYYRQRATAGLIITEGVQPSRVGKGYWRTPGIYDEAHVKGWAKVADAVHAEGSQIVMQLMHTGRASVAANKDPDAETVAPSAIQCKDLIPGPDGTRMETAMPRALETHEVQAVIEEHAEAARKARKAGIDGVELHCTSGYLSMQFLSTGSNKRTDQYGGSTNNRIRFVVETLEAMSAAIGADRVGFRIFPGNPLNDMQDDDPIDTYGTLLSAVNNLGLAYAHLVHVPGCKYDSLELAKGRWTGKILGNNNLEFDTANELIKSGAIDAASFGRHFIGNPDLVERFKTGAPLVPFNRHNLYAGGDAGDAHGYTDYPTLAEQA